MSNYYIKTLSESGTGGKATADDIVKLLQKILDKSQNSATAMQELKELCEKIEQNTATDKEDSEEEDKTDKTEETQS